MRHSKRRSGKSRSKSTSKRRKGSDFAYLMQRKCMRMMRRYYKDKFENSGLFEHYQMEMRSITVTEFDNKLRIFMSDEFSYALEYAEYGRFIELFETLKTLILSDRYNKNEPVIQGLDFDVVRQTLYNFNTRNLINFLSTKGFAFLFFHYFDGGGKNDVLKQTDVEPQALFNEMQELYNESEKYLKITMDNFKERGIEREAQEPSPVGSSEEDYVNHLGNLPNY